MAFTCVPRGERMRDAEEKKKAEENTFVYYVVGRREYEINDVLPRNLSVIPIGTV